MTLFNINNLDNINVIDLKKLFKKKTLEVHPDKGGSDKDFDEIVEAYLYLHEMVQRVSGGRDELTNIKGPDDIKGLRNNDILHSALEELSHEIFNEEFIKRHETTADIKYGYGEWLTEEKSIETPQMDIGMSETPESFNSMFEKSVKIGKPTPQTIILHPDSMATLSGNCLGTDILGEKPDNYSSYFSTTPQFTDLYSAYTNDNTIFDKLPHIYNMDNVCHDIDFETLKEQRNLHITPLSNIELQELAEYEKKQLEKQRQHLEKLRNNNYTIYTIHNTDNMNNTDNKDNTNTNTNNESMMNIDHNYDTFIKTL